MGIGDNEEMEKNAVDENDPMEKKAIEDMEKTGEGDISKSREKVAKEKEAANGKEDSQ